MLPKLMTCLRKRLGEVVKFTTLIAAAAFALTAMTAQADQYDGIDDTPSAMAMAADLVLVRPLGLVATVVGTALFVVTNAGMAGTIGGTVAVTIPGVSITGTLQVSINNTNAAINQTFTVNSDNYTVNLPAGPYLRFEGTNIGITIAGQTLTGNVAFEKLTKSDGSSVVTLAMTGSGIG